MLQLAPDAARDLGVGDVIRYGIRRAAIAEVGMNLQFHLLVGTYPRLNFAQVDAVRGHVTDIEEARRIAALSVAPNDRQLTPPPP